MKSIFSFIVLAFIMLAAVIFTGCNSVTKSTKNKQVNITTEVYGLKVTAFDPASGTLAPTGWVGFGNIQYRSVPVESGQPVLILHEVRSIWNSDNPAIRTAIWVGLAPEKAVLQFEDIPGTMFKISSKGIESGKTTVKIIPYNKVQDTDKEPKNKAPAAAILKTDKNTPKDLSVNMLQDICSDKKLCIKRGFTSQKEPIADANIKV